MRPTSSRSRARTPRPSRTVCIRSSPRSSGSSIRPIRVVIANEALAFAGTAFILNETAPLTLAGLGPAPGAAGAGPKPVDQGRGLRPEAQPDPRQGRSVAAGPHLSRSRRDQSGLLGLSRRLHAEGGDVGAQYLRRHERHWPRSAAFRRDRCSSAAAATKTSPRRASPTKDGRTIRYKRMRFIPQAVRRPALFAKAELGDRPDLIAFRTIGDPEQFWRLCDLNLVQRPVDLTAVPGRARGDPGTGRRRLTWASCRRGLRCRSRSRRCPSPFFQALREIEIETSIGSASIFRLHFDLSRTIFGDFDALAFDIFRPLLAGQDQRRGRPADPAGSDQRLHQGRRS